MSLLGALTAKRYWLGRAILARFILEADGGSRGNPGPAGSGAVVIDAASGEVLAEVARYIGVATNNVAEYRALIAGLEVCRQLDPDAKVDVRMDSKLVIEQMSGRWKIKHVGMKDLAAEARELAIGRVHAFKWIPREQNTLADAVANRAMDEMSDSTNIFAGTQTTSSGNEQTSAPMAAVAEFNLELPSSVRAPGGVTKKLTTLVLVRHGRTALTETKKISGSGGANPSLSLAGRDDAAKVARAIAQIGVSGQWAHLKRPTAIVTSPILRAIETADAIGRPLGITPEVIDGLAEISFGVWDGLTNEEAREWYPEVFEQWRGSWQVSPPGGESLSDFDQRVMQAKDFILEKHEGETVVVVSHVMPTRGFIRSAFDAGISAYWRPQIAPCSMSVLRLWGSESAEILAVNATSHLAE